MSIAELHPARLHRRFSDILPGTALALSIASGAMALQALFDLRLLNPMLVAIIVGVGVRLALGPNGVPHAGLGFAARTVLRAGIVLLGLQVTLVEIGALGPSAFAVAALTLAATYVAVVLLGRAMGLPAPLSRLIAAGTAVCGASAVVAANSVARGSDEDVGYAVAGVTLFGTIAMVILPLMAAPLQLDAANYGVWVGASVHEVAQVTAAAFQLGPEAGQTGTITKLVRVMLLAPLVLLIAFAVRRAGGPNDAPHAVAFPWFVLGFIAFAGANSVLELPDVVRSAAAMATTLFLSTGLAAMGLGMDLGQLKQRGWGPMLLGAFGCVFVLGFGYGAVLVLL